MNKASIKLTSFILVIFIVISSFAFASCSDGDLTEKPSSTPESSSQTSVNEEPFSGSDPSESQNEPPLTPPEDEFTPPDIPSLPDTGDVSLAASQGLRSAVSILASFTVNSFWTGTATGTSAGSGVIYKLDAKNGSAFIITNYHVVFNSASVTENGISDDISIVLFGLEYAEDAIPATYVGGSANYDIAILRVDSNEVLKTAAANGSATAVTVANSDILAAGQTAIAIGNPESSGISVTTGIVSVDSEYIYMTSSTGYGNIELRVVRIDTAVNSGNSGGGLFNSRGELIGIVNAKMNSSNVENIGYAIPSNVARAIADNIIDYCYGSDNESVMRGILGLTVTTDSITTRYDPESGMIIRNENVIVQEISSSGLAEDILKVNDIVKSISIGDKTVSVTRRHHLIDAMLDVRVGDTVSMTVIRDGEEITVSTVITEDCLTAY